MALMPLCRYMVDAADPDKIEAAGNKLHNLLEKPQLAGIPILVLGNKWDLPGALDENGPQCHMNLNAIQVCFYHHCSIIVKLFTITSILLRCIGYLVTH